MDASAVAKEFLTITGAQRMSTARFYLSACGGRLDEAVSMYFDDPHEVDEEPQPAQPARPAPAPAAAAPRSQPPAAAPKPRITGFGDIRGADDSEPKQDYYAGGSKSGLSVADKQESGPALARQLLDAARAHAEHHHDDDDDDDDDMDMDVDTKPKQPERFTGAAYRLDGTQQPAPGPSAASPAHEAGSSGPLDVKVTLWREGFSVNDGPLRPYADENNRQFLEALQKGIVPAELTRERRRVNIALERRLEDAYEPPKRVFKAFEGSGESLQARSSAPSESSSSAKRVKLGAPRPLDESKPKTRVQVRMHDGQRLTAHFNLDHTVGDLRAFVAHAEAVQCAFELQTTFPVKTLTNDDETLQAAGLANAVVVQRKI